MSAADRGWWTIDVADDAAGEDYAYVLDGGDEIPDHARRGSPGACTHGRDTWTTQAHRWDDASFAGASARRCRSLRAARRDLHRRGTFAAAITHLDHLRDLGVSHRRALPVNSFEGSHGWGYDGVALFAPFSRYGGPAG